MRDICSVQDRNHYYVCMVHKCIVYQKCIMSISVPPIVLYILEGSSNNDRNDNCYVLHDLCT